LAKPELGVKRICPITGRKFYDLNKDPVVSPFTGESYPRSAFEPVAKPGRVIAEKPAVKKVPVDDETAEEVEEDVDTISLDDADDEAAGGSVKTVVADDDDVEVDDDADDEVEDAGFLVADEDSDDDVTEIIGDREKDEEG
jgi:uncharacterized protein (TIGR02300 family)